MNTRTRTTRRSRTSRKRGHEQVSFTLPAYYHSRISHKRALSPSKGGRQQGQHLRFDTLSDRAPILLRYAILKRALSPSKGGRQQGQHLRFDTLSDRAPILLRYAILKRALSPSKGGRQQGQHLRFDTLSDRAPILLRYAILKRALSPSKGGRQQGQHLRFDTLSARASTKCDCSNNLRPISGSDCAHSPIGTKNPETLIRTRCSP